MAIKGSARTHFLTFFFCIFCFFSPIDAKESPPADAICQQYGEYDGFGNFNGYPNQMPPGQVGPPPYPMEPMGPYPMDQMMTHPMNQMGPYPMDQMMMPPMETMGQYPMDQMTLPPMDHMGPCPMDSMMNHPMNAMQTYPTDPSQAPFRDSQNTTSDQETQPQNNGASCLLPKTAADYQRASTYAQPNCPPSQEGYTINFEDISIIQLIQFISKISGTNFIFDSADLLDKTKNPPQPYKITLVSQDETSVTDLSSALLQVLKMYGLSVVMQGNNVLIYRNQTMSKVSKVITDRNVNDSCDNAIITRVYKLTNVQAPRMAVIVKTLLSAEANVEPSVETNHLIVTDITSNINKITELLAELDTPSFTVDVADYTVKNAHPVTLAEYAQAILEPLAMGTPLTITPEPVSNKIFIVATPVILSRAKEILACLDVADIQTFHPQPPPAQALQNNEIFMYKLKYQTGLIIADALHEIGTNLQYTGVANIDFVNAIYSAQWIEPNNSIVLSGTGDAIKKVVALLEDLDQLPKQVYIEVLVLDTTLANSLDFGVQWIALGSEQNKLAFASGLLANAPPAANLQAGARNVASNVNPATGSPPLVPNPGRDVALPVPANLAGSAAIPGNATEAFGLGIIGNIIRHNGTSFLTLGALLSALDEDINTKVVLNPKVMVEDNQPANFFVGQNIPYQTTSTVVQQTGSVTQNIQYEDIGVQLQVTPTIAPDNMVTLQINQTISDVTSTSNDLTPTTNKELLTTRVHVPDGTFLVLSGLVRDECTNIHSGIPCLGTLPLIGPAFSRNIEQRVKRNLIFFIRPKVVMSIDDGIVLTNEEGYRYNWETNPCSLIECGCEKAPECEVYPNPCWPPQHPFYPVPSANCPASVQYPGAQPSGGQSSPPPPQQGAAPPPAATTAPLLLPQHSDYPILDRPPEAYYHAPEMQPPAYGPYAPLYGEEYPMYANPPVTYPPGMESGMSYPDQPQYAPGGYPGY